MTAGELNAHLNGLWEDLPESTVDRIIYGDPEAEVAGVAVAWMPYSETLARTRELGANVLVTHEPTFYHHRDLDDEGASAMPQTTVKRAWLDESGITVIRCHDVWDALPEVGIPFAWGRFLGLGEPAVTERYYNVYDIPPQPASAFAAAVAARTTTLGQDRIGFYGDPHAEVRSVGLGTGCISNPFHIFAMGADLAISVDDVVRAWVAGEWSQDTGKPLLVVNHCVAEEPGIVTLAEHLRSAFPSLQVTHIPQRCTYRSISSAG